jgi:cyclohexanecarboxyl-CoA dehydrogenase
VALDDDYRAVTEVAQRFARERLAPQYMAREQVGNIDRAIVREMGDLGLIGVDLPESLGGHGQSSVMAGHIIEAISYGDFNISYVQLLGSLQGTILARHARPDLARYWITRIVSGDAIMAVALTEPRGGSDAANLMLSAKRVGDIYVLNGEKSSISMADQADATIVFARTGQPEDGAKGVSAFIVPMDAKGVTTTRFNDLGSKAVGRGSIFFDSVEIPISHRVADEGQGFAQVMQGFDFSRALIGLQCAGAAQASLDETWAYIKERHTFGVPIAQYQGVTFPLAEAETMTAALRQLAYHTLRLKDAGQPHTSEAAMCKWLGPKTAVDVTHQCLLTHGHYGWSLDLPHQQRMRDVMGLEIGDGTAQIMKLVIARERVGRMALQYSKT